MNIISNKKENIFTQSLLSCASKINDKNYLNQNLVPSLLSPNAYPNLKNIGKIAGLSLISLGLFLQSSHIFSVICQPYLSSQLSLTRFSSDPRVCEVYPFITSPDDLGFLHLRHNEISLYNPLFKMESTTCLTPDLFKMNSKTCLTPDAFFSLKKTEGVFEEMTEHDMETHFGTERILYDQEVRNLYNKIVTNSKNFALEAVNKTPQNSAEIAEKACLTRHNARLYTRKLGPKNSEEDAEYLDKIRSGNTSGLSCKQLLKKYQGDYKKLIEKSGETNQAVNTWLSYIPENRWIRENLIRAGVITRLI